MSNKELINLKLKYKRFLKYKDFFNFNPNIGNMNDLDKYYDEEIEIEHIKCGSIMKMKFSEWMGLHSKNRHVSKEFYNYMCEYCSQKEKNDKFQEELDLYHNQDFLLRGNYTSSKKKVLIYHQDCDNTFSITPSYNKLSSLVCRVCGKSSEYSFNKKAEENDRLFRNKLKELGFDNIIPLEKFKSNKDKMKFKHLYCGETFEYTPNSLFKLKNKNICPKCPDAFVNSISKDQKIRNRYFQGKLNRFYGDEFILLNDYEGINSYVEIKHTKCNLTYSISAQSLSYGKYRCFCEKSNHGMKNLNSIKLSEKIKLYEDILDGKYKILSGFVNTKSIIDIRHLECGHEFKRAVSTFLRSKDRILCPKCNKELLFRKYKSKVDDKYKGEYIVTNNIEYTDYKGDIEVVHTVCNKSFVSNFNVLLGKGHNHCPYCNIKIHNDTDFKRAVFDKFKGEYIVLSPYVNAKEDMFFRHKHCGKRFKLNSREFLNYKTPCPECRRKKKSFTMAQAQEKVNQQFGNLFLLCGIYVNMHKKIPIKCNSCGTILEYSVQNILKRKGCPCCKVKYL